MLTSVLRPRLCPPVPCHARDHPLILPRQADLQRRDPPAGRPHRPRPSSARQAPKSRRRRQRRERVHREGVECSNRSAGLKEGGGGGSSIPCCPSCRFFFFFFLSSFSLYSFSLFSDMCVVLLWGMHGMYAMLSVPSYHPPPPPPSQPDEHERCTFPKDVDRFSPSLFLYLSFFSRVVTDDSCSQVQEGETQGPTYFETCGRRGRCAPQVR